MWNKTKKGKSNTKRKQEWKRRKQRAVSVNRYAILLWWLSTLGNTQLCVCGCGCGCHTQWGSGQRWYSICIYTLTGHQINGNETQGEKVKRRIIILQHGFSKLVQRPKRPPRRNNNSKCNSSKSNNNNKHAKARETWCVWFVFERWEKEQTEKRGGGDGVPRLTSRSMLLLLDLV